MRNRSPKFTMEELDTLKAALKERTLPAKKYPVPDFSEEITMTVASYKRLLATMKSGEVAMLACLKEHPEFL